MTGIIIINKEQDFTSSDVVCIVRKLIGRGERVGHTGTLDPIATGVLPICVGRATKLSDYFMNTHKTYRATIRFGLKTDTQDITGNIIATSECRLDSKALSDILPTFIGKQEQTPPMYSAKKVNGTRLYTLAQQGISIERKPAQIEIFDIKLENCTDTTATILVHCSKGTYIRTLSEDIGARLGMPSCMESLERTASGIFTINEAITLSELKQRVADGQQYLEPVERFLNYPTIIISSEASKFIENGNKINLSFIKGDYDNSQTTFLAKNENGKTIGLYSINQGFLKPEVIL